MNKITRYFILLLPFLEPQIFKTGGLGWGDKCFLVLKLISSCFIIAEYVCRDNYRPSKYLLLMLGVQGLTVFSTVYNHGSLSRCMGPALTAVVIIMLGELVFKSNWKRFIHWLDRLFLVLFILNAFTLVLRYIGVNPFYQNRTTLLGIENRWIYFYLPWIIIAFFNSYIKKGKLDAYSWTVYFLCTFSLLLMWSVGAFLAFMLFPFAYFFILQSFKPQNVPTKSNSKNACRIMFLGVLGINYLLIGGFLLRVFGVIIQKYLHKSLTLSGRVFLWETVMDTLKERPLLGMGVQSTEYDLKNFFLKSGRVLGTAVNHPHNHFLNVAYHGGLLSVVLFMILIYLVMTEIDNIENRQIKAVFFATSVVLFFAALVDTMDFSMFYFLIPMVAYTRKTYGKTGPSNNLLQKLEWKVNGY